MAIFIDAGKKYPDRWLFGDEKKLLTSTGVIIHTGPLRKKGYPCFLLVEQRDQEGHPWGIPAGRVDPDDLTPEQAALREVYEETGLRINASKLYSFLSISPQTPNTLKIVYSYQALESEIRSLGTWYYQRQIGILECHSRLSSEVGRLALVPNFNLFSGDPPITRYYRWDIMHSIKSRLKGLRVI